MTLLNIRTEYQLDLLVFNEICLNRTLNKTKSCVIRTTTKALIIVNLTYHITTFVYVRLI